MNIHAYYCGSLDHSFPDTDKNKIAWMCRMLDSTLNDVWEYREDNGDCILFWRGENGIIHGNVHGNDEREIPLISISNGFSKSFIDGCLAGELSISRIDEYVDFWHTHDTQSSLRDFLGMTPDEYSQWLKSSDPNLIQSILDHRRMEGWESPFVDRLAGAAKKAQDRNAGHAAPDPQRTRYPAPQL